MELKLKRIEKNRLRTGRYARGFLQCEIIGCKDKAEYKVTMSREEYLICSKHQKETIKDQVLESLIANMKDHMLRGYEV